jgi:hypothetical protein
MFLPLRFREFCAVMRRFQRKVVSAEPGIAPHCAGALVYNLNMLFSQLLESQATQCTCNEDGKKSADLRDIPSLDLSQN